MNMDNKFTNSLDHRNWSIYKLNKCVLKKRPATHSLTGPNGLMFEANGKVELIADSVESQFSPNLGP